MNRNKPKKHSKELRALALQFFSFNDSFKTTRTEKYMELSMKLKAMLDETEDMLSTITSVRPFDKYKPLGFGKKENTVNEIKAELNKYSSQTLFASILREAIKCARWSYSYGGSPSRLPNAEAAAWLEYFAVIKKENFHPSDNWHKYYKEHFGSDCLLEDCDESQIQKGQVLRVDRRCLEQRRISR